MGQVRVLDDYYLSITLLITIGYQLFFFSIAWNFKFDKVTDIAGGSNFLLLAALTLGFSGVTYTRNIVTTILVLIWGLRISAFLFYRILTTGKDERFNEMRTKFISFLGFWCFQMAWVWIVSFPIIILNSPAVTRYGNNKFGRAGDIIGIVFWAVGLVVEAVADGQKYRFRTTNKDKKLFMQSGVWKYSRHPNYFGEILAWFGIWAIASSQSIGAGAVTRGGAKAAQIASVIGPLFLAWLLLGLSGIPLSEKPTAKRRYENDENWEEYKEYLNRTSILIPLPPSLYVKIPTVIRRTILFEFPMYVFDPAKDADKSGVNSRRSEEGPLSASQERINEQG